MKREKIIDYWIIEGSICFQNAIISKEMIEARIGIIKHFFADHDLTKLSVVAIF